VLDRNRQRRPRVRVLCTSQSAVAACAVVRNYYYNAAMFRKRRRRTLAINAFRRRDKRLCATNKPRSLVFGRIFFFLNYFSFLLHFHTRLTEFRFRDDRYDVGDRRRELCVRDARIFFTAVETALLDVPR